MKYVILQYYLGRDFYGRNAQLAPWVRACHTRETCIQNSVVLVW